MRDGLLTLPPARGFAESIDVASYLYTSGLLTLRPARGFAKSIDVASPSIGRVIISSPPAKSFQSHNSQPSTITHIPPAHTTPPSSSSKRRIHSAEVEEWMTLSPPEGQITVHATLQNERNNIKPAGSRSCAHPFQRHACLFPHNMPRLSLAILVPIVHLFLLISRNHFQRRTRPLLPVSTR